MARGGGSASGVWQRLTLRGCAITAEGTLLGVVRRMPQLWKLWTVERENLDPRAISDRASPRTRVGLPGIGQDTYPWETPLNGERPDHNSPSS